MNSSKKIILFTGIINALCFDELIKSTTNIECIKIASVWNNEDSSYIEKLNNNNFIVVQNDVFQQSIYKPQFITIVNGLNYIMDNYSHVDIILRTRFDIISNDYIKYLEKIDHLYEDKITIICGIQTDTIYFLDLITCGKNHNMNRFYQLQNIYDSNPPEHFLIKNYINKTIDITKDDIRKNFNFSLDICKQYDIEFIWIRSDAWKNNIRTIPYMKVINEYCKDYFIWT